MFLLQNFVVVEQNKKLHKMEKTYCWYKFGGTNKIKIYENSSSVSVTHTDDSRNHYPGVDFVAFCNCK